MKGEQLALGVQLRSARSFEDYHAAANGRSVALLRHLAGARTEEGLHAAFLYGPCGSGKSHLLQAAAAQAQAQGLAAAYLPLAGLVADGPAVLEGFDRLDLLCLDDIDAVCAQDDWALALIRLLDCLRTAGARWIAAAGAAPERLERARPDLRTRLAAAAALGLQPLGDADRFELLHHSAKARGLALPDEAARWILNHLPRDPASLLGAVEKLDSASLREKRRLTLAFVQRILDG